MSRNGNGLSVAEMSAPPGLTPSGTSSRPVLHLSGTKLRIAFERLVNASESLGGVERFAAAVQLKSTVFQERLADGRVRELAPAQFDEIVPLMSTVRRRIGAVLARLPWETVRGAMVDLLDGAHDTTTTDRRISAFEDALSSPSPRSRGEGRGEGQKQMAAPAAAPHPDPLPIARAMRRGNERFLRDLASEVLHNTLPEHYPLMHRWVWDQKANTGVIRQIWHDPNGAGDDVDHVVIDVADGYETHLVLREELSQFLADNGVFRDMLWHVDLLCAQIYGDYVSAQGGAYLKADFISEADLLEHTRRTLGLDRVGRQRGMGRTSHRTIADAPVTEPSTHDLTNRRPRE